MGFVVIHRAGIKRQDVIALLTLATTEESCNPIDDGQPVMLVSFLSKDDRKGLIKPNYIIEDCDSTGSTATALGLPAIFSITTPRPTTPVLMELVTKQAKAAFCQQVAGTVCTPGSCFLYDRHGM